MWETTSQTCFLLNYVRVKEGFKQKPMKHYLKMYEIFMTIVSTLVLIVIVISTILDSEVNIIDFLRYTLIFFGMGSILALFIYLQEKL